jgi:hypothetical protein
VADLRNDTVENELRLVMCLYLQGKAVEGWRFQAFFYCPTV